MFLVTLLLWTVMCDYVELMIVKVEQGLLQGELRHKWTGNGEFYSFKGIPYAAHPIGILRFQEPQPAMKWEGVRSAKEHGPVCPQVKFGTGEYIPGNEDCLFLNVYTPTPILHGSLPVMFFIHGGGFVSGSGNEDEFGPDFLLDHNVVVVTINYRLGALGFLCLDIKNAPGNAGLKDQVAALKWVQKNIEHFGGDPNKVTIFGQSAGGSSVSLHALSPMSKGLFRRAISMSGVLFNDYSVPFEPRRQGLLLAHKVGLYTNDPYKAFIFLRNASVQDIVTAHPNLLAVDELKDYVIKKQTFPPVVEKYFGDQQFMSENPENLLLRGKTNIQEIVLGHTSQEGITRAVSQMEYILAVYPYFKELLLPANIYTQRKSQDALHLADNVQNHYFGNKEINENNMKEVIRFYSYFVYVFAIYRYLEMWIKGGKNAYLYEFNCISERNVYGKTGLIYGVMGAGHLDDLMYIFNGKKYNIPLNTTSDTYKMITQTCALFTNFAKYGNPTPGRFLGTVWDYYNKHQGILNIGLNLSMEKADLTEINFWRNLYQLAGQRFS